HRFVPRGVVRDAELEIGVALVENGTDGAVELAEIRVVHREEDGEPGPVSELERGRALGGELRARGVGEPFAIVPVVRERQRSQASDERELLAQSFESLRELRKRAVRAECRRNAVL